MEKEKEVSSLSIDNEGKISSLSSDNEGQGCKKFIRLFIIGFVVLLILLIFFCSFIYGLDTSPRQTVQVIAPTPTTGLTCKQAGMCFCGGRDDSRRVDGKFCDMACFCQFNDCHPTFWKNTIDNGCECADPCAGKQCGTWSNGCGGTCPTNTCPAGSTCNSYGMCVGGGCTPQCTSQNTCGPDGCGGVCGYCPYGPCIVNKQTNRGLCSRCKQCEYYDKYITYSCIKLTSGSCDFDGDGNACTADFCDASGVCQPGPIKKICDRDGNACTADFCDANKVCQVGPLKICDNNDPCDGQETCDMTAGCQLGTPRECGDFPYLDTSLGTKHCGDCKDPAKPICSFLGKCIPDDPCANPDGTIKECDPYPDQNLDAKHCGKKCEDPAKPICDSLGICRIRDPLCGTRVCGILNPYTPGNLIDCGKCGDCGKCNVKGQCDPVPNNPPTPCTLPSGEISVCKSGTCFDPCLKSDGTRLVCGDCSQCNNEKCEPLPITPGTSGKICRPEDSSGCDIPEACGWSSDGSCPMDVKQPDGTSCTMSTATISSTSSTSTTSSIISFLMTPVNAVLNFFGVKTTATTVTGTCEGGVCKASFCGDGKIQSPNYDGITEKCDEGMFCSDMSKCTDDSRCNNVIGSDKDCKTRDTTSCWNNCTIRGCGDGILEKQAPYNEECDSGKNCVDTYGKTILPLIRCTYNPNVCSGGASNCRLVDTDACTYNCKIKIDCTKQCLGKKCGFDSCGNQCPPGCSGPTPKCNSKGQCVECLDSTDCPGNCNGNGEICNELGQCEITACQIKPNDVAGTFEGDSQESSSLTCPDRNQGTIPYSTIDITKYDTG